MKKIYLLCFLLIPLASIAQTSGSLTLFSEDGDRFSLFLDGKQQNDLPSAHIRIQGLPDLYYSAKIVFEDGKLGSISKSNLYIADGDDVLRDASYRLRKDRSGKVKLNFYSMVPVQKNFVPLAGVHVFHFGQSSQPDSVSSPKPSEKKISLDSSRKGSLQVFSQNGDKFFLYLDGVKQNDVAKANLSIQGIPGLYYQAKIVFEDGKLSPITKNNLSISDAEDILMDAAYRIRKDKQGKPKLNFYSMNLPGTAPAARSGAYVYQFGNAANAVAMAPAPKKTDQKTASQGIITNIKITDPKAVKAGGANPKAAKPTSGSPATAKAATAEPATKVPSSPKLVKTDSLSTAQKTIVEKASTKETPRPTSEMKKCNGWPMGKGDLAAAKKMIEEAKKEDEKLEAAQSAIASNCVWVSQVTEFCTLLKSEKLKLAFAKYAYKFTIDRKNYSEVVKFLSNENNKKELTKFINTGG